MSVQSQIDRIEQNVANTYAVLAGLGADMPSEQNTDNLARTAGTTKAVLYSEQTLTEAQKAQARENIGAQAELTEADYDSIVQQVIDALGGTPVLGMVDSNNNIVVSGNLPDGTYSVKYEMKDGSKVNIGNLVLVTNVYYTVTNNLTQCINSNNTAKIVEGSAYSATITANNGYELSSVTVTMGGSNVPVTNGVINIANVTGHIVITATATEKVVAPTYTNLFVPSTATLNTRMSGTSKAPKTDNGYVMTALIPIPDTAVTKTSTDAFISVPASMWSASANMFLAKKNGAATEGYCSYSTTKGEVVGAWVKIPLLTEWGTGFTCNGVTLSLKVSGSAITASDIQNIKICFDEIPE